MAEQPFDLVLEHLKSLQSALARVERRQQDDGARLLRVENAILTQRREMAMDAEVAVHAHARLDQLRAEVDRINARLGLVDG